MYTLKSMLAHALIRMARDPHMRTQAQAFVRERVAPAAQAALRDVEPGIAKVRADLGAAAREADPLRQPAAFARSAKRRLFPDSN